MSKNDRIYNLYELNDLIDYICSYPDLFKNSKKFSSDEFSFWSSKSWFDKNFVSRSVSRRIPKDALALFSLSGCSVIFPIWSISRSLL